MYMFDPRDLPLLRSLAGKACHLLRCKPLRVRCRLDRAHQVVEGWAQVETVAAADLGERCVEAV